MNWMAQTNLQLELDMNKYPELFHNLFLMDRLSQPPTSVLRPKQDYLTYLALNKPNPLILKMEAG